MNRRWIADVAADADGQNPGDGLNAVDICAQLACIQGSADFDVPERARKFLRYVVEETLAGRAERIKAYSIALEVFGRDDSFDAQSDPVVRVEAGRLRRALERYYLTGGNRDRILITIPKGGYVPTFAMRAHQEDSPFAEARPVVPTPTGWRPQLPVHQGMAGLHAVSGLVAPPGVPRLLIQPFDDLSGASASAMMARALTEEVIGHFARFENLQVVENPLAAEATATRDGADSLAARYALLGCVRISAGMLRVIARLRQIDNGFVLWAQSYDEDLEGQWLLSVQADIARQVTTVLGLHSGGIDRSRAIYDMQPRRPLAGLIAREAAAASECG